MLVRIEIGDLRSSKTETQSSIDHVHPDKLGRYSPSLHHLTSSRDRWNSKLSAYTSLLGQIYTASSSPQILTENLTSFLSAILAESVSLVITRPVLVDFVSRIDSIPDRESKKQVLTFALDKVHPRAVSFEEQSAAIREKLADIFEEEGDHTAAARALQGITLESGQR
jgi:COP9 signalosome complex subunit 4